MELENNNSNMNLALNKMRNMTKEDFGIVDWNLDEIEAFQDGIKDNGHDLFAIASMVIIFVDICVCIIKLTFIHDNSFDNLTN